MNFTDIDIYKLLLLVWLGALAVQACYYLLLFSRLALRKPAAGHDGNSPVAVVICARNELKNLRNNLQAVLDQQYPAFKVHVVNDCSWDDSERALEEYADAYPHLKVVTIRENERYRHGKKFALTMGIKSAEAGTLLLTDADCRPASPNWIRLMTRHIGEPVEIVIGYGAYLRKKGLLNKWIRFDTLFNAMQYLSYAMAGIPYMGTGRNLCYTRSLFFANKGFAGHHHLVSGDDDLFLNETARAGNTAVEIHPDAFTYSEPKETFGDWLRQKRRHMSTATSYKILHQLMLGMFYASQIVVYAGLAALLVLDYRSRLVITAFAVRAVLQLVVFGGCMRKLKEQDLLIFTPLFDLMIVLIYPILAIFNAFSKVKAWK